MNTWQSAMVAGHTKVALSNAGVSDENGIEF